MIKSIIDYSVSVATLILAGCAVWLIAREAGFVDSAGPQASQRPTTSYFVGEEVPAIDGVDFAAAERTLLVVMKSDCPYCTASSPFYRRILEEQTSRQARERVRIVFVAADSDNQFDKYLAANDLPADSPIRVPFSHLRIRGTPTLLLVNRSGRVESIWEGQVSASTEDEVLETVFKAGAN
jgi:hypothetical protein